MKLIVADSVGMGRAMLKAFGLPKGEWKCVSWGQALGGPKVDRLVIVEPYGGYGAKHAEYIDRLRLTLRPGARGVTFHINGTNGQKS